MAFKNPKNILNASITASDVVLIDNNGSNLGLMTKEDALKKASELNLDLVKVSPDGNEKTICKLMDYGKFIFDKKKNKSSSKVKSKKQTLKEIKFRPSTDKGDFDIKIKKIKSFILQGNKTKISVRFRGREILNSNLGLKLLNDIKTELSDIASVDQEPSLEGRQLLMILSPTSRNN